MAKNKHPDNFEDAVAELELIVNQIENNDIKLDIALERYQQGVLLVKFCQEKLAEVEQKIKMLDPETETLKDLILNE